jgi:hypothetical protein
MRVVKFRRYLLLWIGAVSIAHLGFFISRIGDPSWALLQTPIFMGYVALLTSGLGLACGSVFYLVLRAISDRRAVPKLAVLSPWRLAAIAIFTTGCGPIALAYVVYLYRYPNPWLFALCVALSIGIFVLGLTNVELEGQPENSTRN